MNSIRVFLVVVILAVLSLFTFVAAISGYRSSMEEAERLFDKQLLDTARLIANIHTEKTAGNINHESDIAFQVFLDDRMVASSSNAPGEPITSFSPGFGFANFDGYRWRTISYFDVEHRYRVLAAERTDLRYTLAENVVLESIVPIFLGLPLVGLLIWVIVSQGLKPLRQLADELGNKQPQDLSRLSIHNPKNELAQIVASSNGLLERLETTLLKEKQFASDAAHELRTPISVLKVQLYNISKELPEGDTGAAQLTETANRLEHIVEQILDLYRSSADRFSTSLEPVDLTDLAREVLAEEYGAFDAKQQTLALDGDACSILGDRFALSAMIRNLLSNANKYTPAGGQVRVQISAGENHVLLIVEDSGVGISEKDRESIFDRFYRVGGDRHDTDEPGCGLGLAIVRRIADLHKAAITVGASRFATGTAFHVCFPALQGANFNGAADA